MGQPNPLPPPATAQRMITWRNGLRLELKLPARGQLSLIALAAALKSESDRLAEKALRA